MVNSLQDGLNLPDLLDTAAIQQAEIGSGAILGPHISGGAITNSKLAASTLEASSQGFLGTGSPTGFGLSVQAGSTIPSNIAVTVSFGTAFAAAPHVILTLAASGAVSISPAMVTGTSAGSFTHLGESGLLHHWIAIGSGNI